MSGYLFHRVRGKGGWKQYWVVVSLFTLQHYKNHDVRSMHNHDITQLLTILFVSVFWLQDSNPVSTLVPVDYELAYPDVVCE